jgi:general secretion pathway protein M
MLEPILKKWGALSSRDRRMLGLAVGFLLIVFAWMVAFEPAWNGRNQLARELPVLRTDLAQMDQLAAEAKLAAASTPQSSPSAAELKDRLQASLTDSGLSASLLQMEVNGDLIEARFRQVDFEKWLFWVDSAVRDTRMRVVDISLTRDSPGVISGRLALEAPRRGS